LLGIKGFGGVLKKDNPKQTLGCVGLF